MRKMAASLGSLALLLEVGGCNGGLSDGGFINFPLTLYWSVAIADVNGDGKADIVASYTVSTSVTSSQGFVGVYLQNGAQPGTFLSPTTYSVGLDPVSLTIGDLNGDGKPDIAVVSASSRGSGSNGVTVLLQDASNPGHYHAGTSYPTGMFPNAVAIGDLDGDGRPDLAVADSTGVSVLLQSPNSPGTFLAATTIAIGMGASSVAIADLNADHKVDLIATNGASVEVFLQDPTKAGMFLAPVSYAAGLQPVWVTVADLNGDGAPDLAVANQGSPSDGTTASVSVLLQNPAMPGAYLGAVDYKADRASAQVLVRDLNGDGKLDLAVANASSISILVQSANVAGQYGNATNYSALVPVTSIALGDLNGDLKPDLVIADGDGIVIRFQDPANPGVFLPQVIIAK